MRIRNLFTDKEDKIVIWQAPSPLLVLWLCMTLVQHVLPHGWVHNLAELLSLGFLFTWSWLEITAGASYFRRGLGVVVLLAIIRSRI